MKHRALSLLALTTIASTALAMENNPQPQTVQNFMAQLLQPISEQYEKVQAAEDKEAFLKERDELERIAVPRLNVLTAFAKDTLSKLDAIKKNKN